MKQDIKQLGIAEYYFPGFLSGKIKDEELISTISCFIVEIFYNSEINQPV